jgi:hypothetical protein
VSSGHLASHTCPPAKLLSLWLAARLLSSALPMLTTAWPRSRPPHHAAVSNAPSIVGVSGNATGAVLSVVRPDLVGNDDAVSYLIQTYECSNLACDTATALGAEVDGVNYNATGSGTSDAPFQFYVPHLRADFLRFEVTVVEGITRSNTSQPSQVVVVGEHSGAGCACAVPGCGCSGCLWLACGRWVGCCALQSGGCLVCGIADCLPAGQRRGLQRSTGC